MAKRKKKIEKRVVMFSGGVGSWMTARRVKERFGTKGLILLFADTKIEDPDLYRFLGEATANIGGTFVKIEDGRTPFQVFHDVRFLGNSRIDPCSRVLKRELMRKWLEDNCDPKATRCYLGIDWTEEHRFTKAKAFWKPWSVRSPLCDPPYIEKPQMIEMLQAEGIEPPRLYKLGFPHNNCGGGCVKAGQAQFKLLLEKLPERYAWWETQERDVMDRLDRKVTILKKTVDGEQKFLSLTQFRRMVERGEPIDETEWGGCACFTPNDYLKEPDKT